jgi:hypothetical protein
MRGNTKKNQLHETVLKKLAHYPSINFVLTSPFLSVFLEQQTKLYFRNSTQSTRKITSMKFHKGEKQHLLSGIMLAKSSIR